MLFGDPDRTIHKRLLQRDPRGVELLTRTYGKLLWCVVSSYLGGARKEDIEETFSDALFSIWMDVEKYDAQRASFKTWLVMKARYCSLMRRRKLARESHQLNPLPADEISLSPPDTALRVDLALALKELKPLDRQIVYLCDYLRWERQAVADELGMKVNAVNTRLHRIRKRLRQSLHAWK